MEIMYKLTERKIKRKNQEKKKKRIAINSINLNGQRSAASTTAGFESWTMQTRELSKC